MSPLTADKTNGAAVHRGDIATTIQVQANGVGSTAIRATGVIQDGTGVTAQAMATSRSMTTTMNMPIKGITRAAAGVGEAYGVEFNMTGRRRQQRNCQRGGRQQCHRL